MNKVRLSLDAKKVLSNMSRIGRSAQRWANAANYEYARKTVYHNSVNVYAPHSGLNNYGQKRWGSRLTDSASIYPLRQGPTVAAVIEFSAPQSALLHELGFPPNPFVNRPGQPEFLKRAFDEAVEMYSLQVSKLLYLYMNGTKPGQISRRAKGEGST